MTHLTDAEVVDLLDGTLASARQRHLDACDSCRATAAALREVSTRATNATIPEPSPLFWEHFSAHVREGVQKAEIVQPSRWLIWTLDAPVKWAVAGAALTLVLVSGVWVGVWRRSAPEHTLGTSDVTSSTVADGSADRNAATLDAFDSYSPDSDEAWSLVRTVADDVAWDDDAVDGLGVRPGSVEHALAALSGDERSELVRLLQAETKQPGA